MTLSRRTFILIIIVLAMAGLSWVATGIVVAGPPDSLAIQASSNNQYAEVGSAFPNALRVRVLDASSIGVAGETVTLTVNPVGSADATLSDYTPVSNVNGWVTVTATAIGAPGTYTVTATLGSLTQTITLTNTGSPDQLVVTGAASNQSTPTGSPFPYTLRARVVDSDGRPIPNKTVTFSAAVAGGGATASLTPTTVTSNVNGYADSFAMANAISGTYDVTATLGSLTATFTLTNTGVPAALELISGDGQTTPTDSSFPNGLRVRVVDALGGPIAGETVTFTVIPAGGAGATLSTDTAISNVNGYADIATVTANNIAGTYQVRASLGGIEAFFTLTNAGVPAALQLISGSNQSAAIGTNFALGLRVQVVDSVGSPIAGETVTFTVIPVGGAGATLSALTAVSNVNGYADVATVTANGTPGAYTIEATLNSLTATFNLVNAGVPAATLQIVSGNHQTAGTDDVFTHGLRVRVVDATNTPIPGETVLFTVHAVGGAGATLSALTAVSNVNGYADIATVTANGTPGSYTVEATLATLTATFHLTNAGAPVNLVIAGGADVQYTTVNTAFGASLRVRVVDASGTPIPGETVTYTVYPVGSAGATLSTATPVSNVNGYADVTATANGTPGSYTVEATLGALTATFQLTNAGTPVALIPSNAAMGQVTRINTPFPATLRFRVVDADGNPVPGVVVNFTVNPNGGAGATLSAANVTSNINGFADVTATANGVPGSYTVTASIAGATEEIALENALLAPVVASMACDGLDLVITLSGDAPFDVTGSGAGLPVSGVTAASLRLTGPGTWTGVTAVERAGDLESSVLGDITCDESTIPPWSGIPVPNHGRVMIGAGANATVYDAPGGQPVLLADGRALTLPQDTDGSGSDTYTVAAFATVDGTRWVGLFIGSATWAWVPFEDVAPMGDFLWPSDW